MNHVNLTRHDLGDGVCLFTDSVHRFGTDGVLLADFAAPRRQDKTVEFGTGCGIISLIWLRNGSPARMQAFDIQPAAVDLVQMAVAENHAADRLYVAVQDLRCLPADYPKGYYDLVVMNPPYKKAEDGVISPQNGLAVARHEIACNWEQICRAAADLLNTGGRFCCCHRPARLAEVMVTLHNAGLEPKRLRLVHQRPGAAPNLVLIESKKGAFPGLIVEPPFYLEDASGAVSSQARAAYGAYFTQKECAK